MKQSIELMLDLVGYILHRLALMSPKIRRRFRNAALYDGAVDTAQTVYAGLQRAQAADSPGGEAVTKAELLGIIEDAAEGLRDLAGAVREAE